MKLDRYLKKKKISKTDFARRLKISRMTLYHKLSGERAWRADEILRVMDETKGAVQFKDLA